MKQYCLVKDGVITEGPCELPVVAHNISNFHAAGNEFVKKYGWLPVEEVSENKEIYVSSYYEILEDKVVKHSLTRDKTANETDKEKWNEVRLQRDRLLADTDKLTLSDRWEKLTTEQRQALSEYRQQLRDIPNKFDDPNTVIFPTL